MRIQAYKLLFLALATMAAAQCPVSGDSSTCTTPEPPANKPASSRPQKSAKAAAPSHPKAAAQVSAAPEGTITRAQADAILVELKEIHSLLEKQQPAPSSADYPKIDFEATPVVKLPYDNHWDNVMGRDEAPMVLVEYSDYQCPHCAKFHTEMFDAIKKKYIDTGKLQFESRDLPLPFHPWALIAAEASHCAGAQGKYWEMRDWLMRHSEQLSPAVIEQGAHALQLDMTGYDICMESRQNYTSVKSEGAAAMAAQIIATPAFVIGKKGPEGVEGKRKFGVGSVADLEAFIDEALGAKK